ncbi:peptidoglycan-binding protein [Streptomyces prunicolor]|uniref:peptidoglycan-binding protein n=1 Tax=Streptomyces prunicolor TaxID=67348 RepID=UPI0037D7756F
MTSTPTVTKAPPATVTTTVTPPAGTAPKGPATSCDYTSSRPTIKNGSSGAAVRQAQCYLNLSMTGDTIPEDGNFGPVTEVATRRFQTCANITVDGLIGPETWSYLICWASSPNYLC